VYFLLVVFEEQGERPLFRPSTPVDCLGEVVAGIRTVESRQDNSAGKAKQRRWWSTLLRLSCSRSRSKALKRGYLFSLIFPC